MLINNMLSLLISLLHFLQEFCRLVHGFFSLLLPICYRSFTLLKALAKSNGNLFAIAFKSDNYRNSWKSDNFRERATKKEAKN